MTDETFETRLLSRLHDIAASPVPAPARRPRRRAAVTLGIAGTGLVLAGSAAAVGILPGDAGKQAVERGAPAGSMVASDGGWSVYAAPRAGGGYDVTVSSGELTTGSVSGAAGPALEATYVQTSSGDAIVGRARAKGAARVRIGLPDGTARAAAVGPHGFFVVALAPGDRPGEGALTLRAVGGGGATLATTRIAADG